MALYAVVAGGALVSIGRVADTRAGGQIVPVIPEGAVMVSEAEYAALREDEAATIAAVIARAAP